MFFFFSQIFLSMISYTQTSPVHMKLATWLRFDKVCVPRWAGPSVLAPPEVGQAHNTFRAIDYQPFSQKLRFFYVKMASRRCINLAHYGTFVVWHHLVNNVQTKTTALCMFKTLGPFTLCITTTLFGCTAHFMTFCPLGADTFQNLQNHLS